MVELALKPKRSPRAQPQDRQWGPFTDRAVNAAGKEVHVDSGDCVHVQGFECPGVVSYGPDEEGDYTVLFNDGSGSGFIKESQMKRIPSARQLHLVQYHPGDGLSVPKFVEVNRIVECIVEVPVKILVHPNTRFDFAGCEAPMKMSTPEANAYLCANKGQYMGFMTADDAPGSVSFAWPDTALENSASHQCYILDKSGAPGRGQDNRILHTIHVLKSGDRVVVVEEILADNEPPCTLLRGERGSVLEIDEEGDAMIMFDEHERENWVFNIKFCNLMKEVPKES